jgi:hypothetical protein
MVSRPGVTQEMPYNRSHAGIQSASPRRPHRARRANQNLPDGAEVRLLAVDGDDLDEQDRKELHAAIEAGERELDLGRGAAEGELADVIRAGVEAIDHAGNASDPPHDWADYMRYRFEEGRKAFARGEAVPTEPDALMDSIERELGLT